MSERFHEGEIAVQERAGVRAQAARVGRILRDVLPEGADAFLARRPFVALASVDADGFPWASVLWGAPGFVVATDPRTVQIAARPSVGDPLAANVRDGAPVGLLAIDLVDRQRLRVNGVVARAPDGSLVLRVREAYPNCPKYIQARQPAFPEAPAPTPGPVVASDALSPSQVAWLAAADTLFVASLHPTSGADASHRGGEPGFVRVEGPRRLVLPDYAGNTMFNTLGNVASTGRLGLVVLDFARGASLQLTGRAAIDWDPAHAATVPGAQRLVGVDVARVIERDGVVPARWVLRSRSPYNPPAA